MNHNENSIIYILYTNDNESEKIYKHFIKKCNEEFPSLLNKDFCFTKIKFKILYVNNDMNYFNEIFTTLSPKDACKIIDEIIYKISIQYTRKLQSILIYEKGEKEKTE